MHVSTMVRRNAALLAVIVATGACSDAPSAPRAPAARPDILNDAIALSAARSASYGHGRSNDAEKLEATFTVDPRRADVYSFGRNWIYFPANSICDPATSRYGLGEWDKPCEPLRKPIQVTARWSTKGGHGFVEFEPELRFVPSAHTSQWVFLSVYDRKLSRNTDDYNLLWCAGDDLWVDEALTDPTLKVWIDREHNSVVRRIKHFSGYMITAAFADFGGLDAQY